MIFFNFIRDENTLLRFWMIHLKIRRLNQKKQLKNWKQFEQVLEWFRYDFCVWQHYNTITATPLRLLIPFDALNFVNFTSI